LGENFVGNTRERKGRGKGFNSKGVKTSRKVDFNGKNSCLLSRKPSKGTGYRLGKGTVRTGQL